MTHVLYDYYKAPEGSLTHLLGSADSGDTGFFRFGVETICYGQSLSGVTSSLETSMACDASKDVHSIDLTIHLPFDPGRIIENLRCERYETALMARSWGMAAGGWVHKPYYLVRELLPVSVRRQIQRFYLGDWPSRAFPSWPVDFTVDTLHGEF